MQARAHAVVDVVRVVGDLVGQVAQLRLEAGLRAVQEAPGHAAGFGRLDALGIRARAVLEDALAGLEAEVQAVVLRVAVLQFVDHPQALQVVLEAAVPGHAGVQRVLPGVAEGRVAQVVRQGNRLDQVFVHGRRARAIERPSCATSSECVMRVRNRSPSWFRNTWVL
jgi:hypothetical protein